MTISDFDGAFWTWVGDSDDLVKGRCVHLNKARKSQHVATSAAKLLPYAENANLIRSDFRWKFLFPPRFQTLIL